MLSKSQVKYIQSLGQKKFRDAEGCFIAEGPKILNELLTEIPQQIITVFGLKEYHSAYQQLLSSVEFLTISGSELEKISQLATPNSVLAIVKQMDKPEMSTTGRVTLVLDTIQDPGNLGTIIRTADWFGIKQIVCSENSADCYNPKVIQATMGSIVRVSIFYTVLGDWLTRQNAAIYAAALDGDDIRKMNRLTEAIIMIGNESKGIHPELLKLASRQITIPKPGQAESLNAAVATAIILSHIV